ncbi:ester cyclase [Williamsia sterculiae]|uniref:SnoaL-like polyketide cyclase n=1 Tax=Williamsia sterculiae TaxID=1344003 RepID=A0A1N7H3L6_9NOCA|nr:ester cyclase [Williamsia sterculiae]SIS19437.1 SnoaL-like polyketide cyclase [Williamsia sterculiae]
MIDKAEMVAVATKSLMDMGSGDRAAFDATIHPEATNREGVDEPPACRGRGPEAFWQTALWLRAAYPDLRYDVHEMVTDGDFVVAHATMSGTHRGPFVVYDANAEIKQVFAPTGKDFAVTQSHWYRIRGGLCVEHWANRDDLGMAEQLGWVPPSPGYLWRCARAKRTAVRAQATALAPAAHTSPTSMV